MEGRLGFRAVWGLGFRALGLTFRVEGLGRAGYMNRQDRLDLTLLQGVVFLCPRSCAIWGGGLSEQAMRFRALGLGLGISGLTFSLTDSGLVWGFRFRANRK